MKSIHRLVAVLAISTFAVSSYAAKVPKLVSTSNGTITGILTYANMAYWIETANENVCIQYDMSDNKVDDLLMTMNGKKVTFTGPIQTWANQQMKHCVEVNSNNSPKVTK